MSLRTDQKTDKPKYKLIDRPPEAGSCGGCLVNPTQSTLAFSDVIHDEAEGRTEISSDRCPSCRSTPVALRRLTAKVWRCRFCSSIVVARDGVLTVAVERRAAR